MDPLPPSYAASHRSLHRVAVHVLARRRQVLTGRIGLRPSPGGIGMPASGPDHEVLRTSGARLLREVTGDAARTTALDLGGATLGEAAAFAGVDLAAPLDVGHDTPPVGDPDAPLAVDDHAARALGGWLAFGWSVLDGVLAERGSAATPTVLQLWPEHFDGGADLDAGRGRTNVGASTGDGADPVPYLYVGPWGPERPGDPAYWNAPFGAVLRHDELVGATDPAAVATAFLRQGLDLLQAG